MNTQDDDDVDVLEPEIINEAEVVKSEEVPTAPVDEDFAFMRDALYDTVGKAQEALDSVLHLAKDTDHPRAFEVAGQMVKHIADLSGQIMSLHKDIQKIKEPKGPSTVVNNNKAVFIGNSRDLQKLVAGKLDDVKISDEDPEK